MNIKNKEVKSLEGAIEATLYQKSNNLDGKDNLDSLPNLAAVYAICGRINGKPHNCRFVGETDNLRDTIKQYFESTATDDCVITFVQSIKIKTLVYKVVSDSKNDRKIMCREWQEFLNPECNEILNETF